MSEQIAMKRDWVYIGCVVLGYTGVVAWLSGLAYIIVKYS